MQVLKDLKLDNDTVNRVRTLAVWAGKEIPAEAAGVRRAMSGMSPLVWDALLDLNGCGEAIRRLTAEIRERGDCLDLKHLAVSGQDLIEAGIKPGKEMGELLQRLLELVLECPQKNERGTLLKEAGIQGIKL